MRLLATILSCAVCLGGFSQPLPRYLDHTAPIEERVEDALGRMTLEEKVRMLHAQSKFSSAGVPRLGIPELWCADGPHGIRGEVFWDSWDNAGWTNDSCTAFPALTCLAATWRPELAREYGRAIGEEARYRGKDILLAPGVNMLRTPLNGRNFEYFGEDPFLVSVMAVPYIQGVQSNNVAACLKHFALNNNELNRNFSNVHVSDRALHEIYLPAFKAGVRQGGAWAVMPSYNLFENRHACENPRLIKEILKKGWGFDGITISDWGGVHDTDRVLDGGLDLEMGTGTDGLRADMNAYDTYHMANPYLERLRNGRASGEELNDHVRRVLRTIFRTSMAPSHWKGRFTCPEHYTVARRIGAEGIVLLKNNGVLPVSDKKKILVVGENAVKMLTIGGGSSSLKAQKEVSPLEGLRNALRGKAEVDWERGYMGTGPVVYNNVRSKDFNLLSETRDSLRLIADALKKARMSDLVIFVGGLNKEDYQDCEDKDRISLNLPYGQEGLIEALATVNPNIVVVNVSGNPVAMPWADKVAAIVQDWYLGSEAGNSLADVLTGAVNPSGKLPFTIPYRLEDTPAWGERRYPGIKRADSNIYDIYYDEDILIGYRWYDTKNIPVQFPFGYGLSYTSFNIGKPVVTRTADGYSLRADVSNAGRLPGAETVQVYVSAPKQKGLLRERKKLVGFSKIDLAPGETREVSIDIPFSSLAYYDEGTASERIVNGKYVFSVGSSSADLPHKITVKYD